MALTYGSWEDLTITLASVADGNGRKSAYYDNSTNKWERIQVEAQIRSGTTGGTAGTIYEFWMYTADTEGTAFHTDDLSTGDVALTATPENADMIAASVVTNTANKKFTTRAEVSVVGLTEFAIAFMNETGQTIHATEADSFIRIRGIKS